MMNEDFALRPDANVTRHESFPDGNRFYIPDGGLEGGRDGVVVTFGSGTKNEWTGVFAFGMNGNLATQAIVPLPNSDRVLVVSNGDGFIIRESVCGEFEKVRAVPVRSVHVIESHRIVVLADDTSLSAYGQNGLVWETNRIAWHELRVESVTGNEISCKTFDIRSDEDVSFTVDLETGNCHGGIEVI
jgi:hypothetical protein